MADLKRLLNPKSVALIGASQNRAKLGSQILSNLKKGGFTGKIYPVNSKYKKIQGLKSYPSVLKIDSHIDLAVIVIPAGFVNQVLEECGEKGIKNVIIISADFSEAGEEGKKREKRLEKIASEYKLNILGPNCLGLVNSSRNLNATFADFSFTKTREPGIAFISQSGAMGSAVFDWSTGQALNLKYFLSLGNKAVLGENNFLDYFKDDPQVSVVAAYLEEIEDGQGFMETVSRLTPYKPVIVFKSGQSRAGKSAALSHTGSMAGSSQAVEAGLARSGAITADNLENFFSLLKFFQVAGSRETNRFSSGGVQVVSNAGGPLVATADSLDSQGVNLPKLSDQAVKKLKKEIPELTDYKNPLDILGDADEQRYKKALETVSREKNISSVLTLLTPQSGTRVKKTSQVLNKVARKNSKKLFLSCFLGGEAVQEAKDYLNKQPEIVNFDYPGQVSFCLAKWREYREKSKALKPFQALNKEKEGIKPKNKSWDYLDSFKLLQKYKIPVLKTEKVTGKKDLEKLRYPLVVKRVGPEIIHKTDKKGIILGIQNKAEALKALKTLEKRFKSGYSVAQSQESGQEILLGFKRDPSFGPLIMVGLGGIYTEIFKDIRIEVGDLSLERARKMIKNLRVYPLLKGARGEKGYDLKALEKALLSLATLARENPEISELDINPFFLQEKRGLAGDVRVIE